MGREGFRRLRADWEAVKDNIMREAVLAKFAQHPNLMSLLPSTSDAEIVEHTKNDAYWDVGRNMLGRVLTEVRRLGRSKLPNAATDRPRSL